MSYEDYEYEAKIDAAYEWWLEENPDTWHICNEVRQKTGVAVIPEEFVDMTFGVVGVQVPGQVRRVVNDYWFEQGEKEAEMAERI